jgi:hypothetical protein
MCGLGIWIILILIAISEQSDIQLTFYTYLIQIGNDYLFLEMI